MNDKIDQAILQWIDDPGKNKSPYVVISQSLYNPIIYRLVYSQPPNSIFDSINSNKSEIFLRGYTLSFITIVFCLNNILLGRVSFDE